MRGLTAVLALALLPFSDGSAHVINPWTREVVDVLPAPEARSVWDDLADCESGDWLDGGHAFVEGSARWDWAKPGTDVPPWGTTIHHGGLQFAPSTWTWVAPMVELGHIEHAYDATRAEQIRVAERVQELQGWQAWPVCSQKLGLR